MASSDLYTFDGFSSSSSSSIYRNSSPDTDLFCNNELYSADESLSFFVPPSDLLGTLTLSHQIPTGLLQDCYNQTETVASIENEGRYMQRSFSTNSVHQNPFNNIPITDSSNFSYNTLKSPENVFFSGQMRRVYSTGDLQNCYENSRKNLGEKKVSISDEQTMKVGRYSAEERKEKISKYRAKRNHRNFTKTIKYACRKTLADSRPRIRGRFARNDEVLQIPNIQHDYTDLWKLDGLHEEDESFMSSFVVQQSDLHYSTSSSSSSFW